MIGVPDERWGEVGCAYLLLRPGAMPPDETALTDFCLKRLARFKVPKRFVIRTDFPRTAAGKILKHLLRQETAAL